MENNQEAPKEKSTIEIIESLKETNEFQTLLKNSNEAYFNANIGEKVREAYTNIDNVFDEVLGVKKQQHQKTSEIAKGLLLELKTLRENKGNSKKTDDILAEHKKLSTAKSNKLMSELKEAQEQISKLQLGHKQQIIKNELSNILAQKTFNPALGETELKELLEIRTNRLVNNSKRHEGKTIYYKDAEKTQPYLNTLGDPMTAAEVSNVVYSSLFLNKKAGGSAKPETQNNTTIEGNIVSLDMSKIKNFEQANQQFSDAMATKGIPSHDKKYIDLQRETFKHYDILKLPLS
jgi:hypothetical protein